ncbi:MAG: 2-C-methyl-D-erythritol 4-phosphate cytidylyltransferase [Terriglobia bacterium]
MKAIAIIPAAGTGTRMRASSPKQFLTLDGSPILAHTLKKFAACRLIQRIIVPVRKPDLPRVQEVVEKEGLSASVKLVPGGIHRQDSVFAGLKAVDEDTEIVVVHDAVRPFVDVSLIEEVIKEAAATGSAIVAVPCTDTVKQIEKNLVTATLPRDKIVLVQTPQAFRYSILKEGFEKAAAENFYATDESCLIERLGYPVSVLRGSDLNIKITKPSDLPLAELYIKLQASSSKTA